MSVFTFGNPLVLNAPHFCPMLHPDRPNTTLLFVIITLITFCYLAVNLLFDQSISRECQENVGVAIVTGS